ncbi:unnamed protein product [Cylicocyclus nassatus]|uniref:Apple domain-containing protein n=1 Tax=Cylicocyclus nassatus TaxID=53992 RepID=A0AA36M340_CYLNA|nr:unnamed protein product [Cylicocyclus nassatus]
MCFITVQGTLMAYLIAMQIQLVFECTFTPYQEEFAASVKYEMLKENERECLQACYEEPDCTFAQFAQLITGVCTIYKNSSETQNGTGLVYSLDRELVTSHCLQPLPVAPELEFQTIFEQVVKQNETERTRLLAQNTSAPLTAIYEFNYAGRPFYSQKASLFSDGRNPLYK